MADDSKIPKGRLRRSAKLGSIVGVQGARYAGTKAANVGRSEEGGKEALEQRHLETAMKMVGALGQMKGAAMKLGQFASFIDTEFIPEEYREIYQEQLAKLRTDAPAMPWEKVEKVLTRSTTANRSPSSSPRSSTRPSPPPRSARCTGPSCSTAAASR